MTASQCSTFHDNKSNRIKKKNVYILFWIVCSPLVRKRTTIMRWSVRWDATFSLHVSWLLLTQNRAYRTPGALVSSAGSNTMESLKQAFLALLLSELSSVVAFLFPSQQAWNSTPAGRCGHCLKKYTGWECQTFNFLSFATHLFQFQLFRSLLSCWKQDDFQQDNSGEDKDGN